MGLILAAPASGSGKTTITLGVLRALAQRGVAVRAAKSGPDYIDPQFHAAACGAPCFNLDAWAMTPARIKDAAAGTEPLLIEGAMGLFDGAPPDGKGATADLARILDLPVVLIVDAASMAQSIAPLVAGFAAHDPANTIGGVILNRVGSARHARMLTTALAPTGIPVIGTVMRNPDLARPSRHLGLVQAGEMPDLENFLNRAADVMASSIDLDALLALGRPIQSTSPLRSDRFRGLQKGQSLAIARDAAFSFSYAYDLALYAHMGVDLRYFSPLADDPVPQADRIILPGGYPELHAARLAAAQTFMTSLKSAAETTDIYGECGGYMTLGETLTDADGVRHKMAGLLKLDTSFATRKLHLGYRTLHKHGQSQPAFRAHEFHYATTLRAEGTPLFDAFDAEGTALGPMGLQEGRVSGSFAHIVSGT
ncbi:cobyrinate a,c-diamide synthase [Yoonia sp. R2331]|uniref:cobyrinate a,c-diamide synthase n=1 Tax=Yoonia sp. R2331 TaxID=3237238 RepID=UPI0034E39CD3